MAVGDILKIVDQEDFTKTFNTPYFVIQAAPVSGNVGLMITANVTGGVELKQVSYGTANSGGTGYRSLRIPN